MSSGKMFNSQTGQRWSYLTTLVAEMFGRVAAIVSNLKKHMDVQHVAGGPFCGSWDDFLQPLSVIKILQQINYCR